MDHLIIISVHLVQQFQTGATFLKRAFKVELFSCLVQNSISCLENLLLTVEGTILNYNCNIAKQTAIMCYFPSSEKHVTCAKRSELQSIIEKNSIIIFNEIKLILVID